jgi:protein TonB
MEEILFRNRNRDYGAYQLRRKYPRVVMIVTILVLLIFTGIMFLWLYWPESHKKKITETYVVFGNAGDGNLSKPSSDNPPPSGGSSRAFTVPQVVDSIPPSDTLINQADGNGSDSTGNGNGNGNGDGYGPVYMAAQQSPSFPGGEKERQRFLQQNIIYPPDARTKKISGVVYVSFIVERSGNISGAKILRGIGYGCDEEALRVINSMPRWTPGRQNGLPVRVQVVIPLHFVWKGN